MIAKWRGAGRTRSWKWKGLTRVYGTTGVNRNRKGKIYKEITVLEVAYFDGVEQTHRGFAFPCSRRQLRALRRQIDRFLNAPPQA